MNWADVAWALGWPPFWTFGAPLVWHAWRKRPWRLCLAGWIHRWWPGCLGVVISGFALSYAPESVIGVLLALAGAAVWWWTRRRRDRAPRAYGAKSRARVAVLVARAREAGRSRRVLRPVPGGVG